MQTTHTRCQVLSFRELLFQRLEQRGVTRDIALLVLQEIAVTTEMYNAEARRQELAALAEARQIGNVVQLRPGAALEKLEGERAVATAATRHKAARDTSTWLAKHIVGTEL